MLLQRCIFSPVLIRIVCTLWLWVIALQLPAFAQERLTLQSALSYALDHNFAIKLGKNTQHIAEVNNTLGNAGMLPILNLNATFTGASNNIRQVFLRDNAVQELDRAHSDQLNSNVQMIWTLFDGLAMFASKDRLEKMEAQSGTALRNTIEFTISSVMQSYATILQQQYLLIAQRDALAISRERYRIAETKIGIGAASSLDVLQARNDMNADSAAVLRQLAIIANAKNQLNVLLGRSAMIPFEAVDSLSMPTQTFSLENLKQRIEQQNTALQFARMSIALTEQDIAVARAQHLPDINLIATVGFNRGQQNFGLVGLNQNQFSSVGLQVSLPLFAGFNIERQVETASLARASAQLTLLQLQLQTEAQIATLLRDYENSVQLAQFEQEGLSAARQNAKIAIEKYRLGGLSSIELRDVQRTLFAAESRFYAALLNARLSETEILRLSGQLVK
jgi:outer membrane protein